MDGTVTEPVKVRPLDGEAVDAARAWGDLRAELTGMTCGTHDEVDEVIRHVLLRLGQLSDRQRGQLLAMFAIQNLAGVRDGKAITVPKRILNERLAARR